MIAKIVPKMKTASTAKIRGPQRLSDLLDDFGKALSVEPMGRCAKCGRSDFLVQLTSSGLCSECEHRSEQQRLLIRRANFGGRDSQFLSEFNQNQVDSKALEACRAWMYSRNLECPKRGLYLFGPTGSGKTFLSLGIALREIQRHSRSVLFINLPTLFEDLIAAMSSHDESPVRLLKAARTVPLLILDDVGVEHSKDWGQRKLMPILEARDPLRLPTIYTSNLSFSRQKRVPGFETLEEFLGARVADRIFKTAIPVEVPGNSLRLA